MKKQFMNKRYLIFGIIFIVLLVFGCAAKNFECPNGTIVNDITLCSQDVNEDESNNGNNNMVVDSEKDNVVNSQNGDITDSSVTITESEVKDNKNPQLTLTQEQKDELDNLLVNRKSAIYPAMLSVNEQVPIGGTYTFAYALKNTDIKEKEIKYSIELLSSKSISLSNTGADDTVFDWFSLTDTGATYILGKNEVAYIPIIIVVGDKMSEDGKDTVAGTYSFRITSEVIDGPFTDDYHYVDFILRVTD